MSWRDATDTQKSVKVTKVPCVTGRRTNFSKKKKLTELPVRPLASTSKMCHVPDTWSQVGAVRKSEKKNRLHPNRNGGAGDKPGAPCVTDHQENRAQGRCTRATHTHKAKTVAKHSELHEKKLRNVTNERKKRWYPILRQQVTR